MMKILNQMFVLLAVAIAVAGGHQTASGVIIHGDPTDVAENPAAYTEQPSDDLGWDYVGRFGAGNGIYLGNGWVLTARHFSLASTVTIAGDSYNRISGTTVNLANPNPGEGSPDLRMFQIDGDPGLAPISIASSSPLINSEVVMIGHGVGRGSALTNLTGPSQGYQWGDSSTREQVWGINVVSVPTTLEEPDGSSYSTYGFRTSFDNVEGYAQAALHDSGGGVFASNGDDWELIGMIFAASATSSGGDTYATWGGVNPSQTYIADLSIYRDQIMAVVPEPGSLALLGFAGLALLRRRRTA